MKHLISHYSLFTEDFNLIGKIIVGAVTGLIVTCIIALIFGLILQGAPGAIGYAG
jgi:FtsH-binding integral membrane protein